MMNDQEMQFADPEWRPRQNGSQAAAGPEPYSPQPINMEQVEQSRWAGPAPEQVYMAQEPPPYQTYQPQMGIGGQYGQIRPRRRRSIWPWIIAAIILFAVIGGNMGRSFGDRGNFMNKAVPAQQAPFSSLQKFYVGSQTTITINDLQGNVHIQSNGGQNVVTVQSDGPGKAIATQNDANSLQITESDPANNMTVTVPDNAKLVVIGGGDVNVEGVSGQMTLTSMNGTIDLNNVTLTGNSIIKTASGDITFDGSLDPNSSDQFISSTGSIDLTLPQNSAFQAKMNTSGKISSSYPLSPPQDSGSVAQVSAGNGPQATVTISTGGGDISLNSQ